MISDASYAPGLRSSAVRGGLFLVVCALLFTPWLNGRFRLSDAFICFAVLWLVFPLGAILGGCILKRLRNLSLPRLAMAGLGIGLLSGLLLALLMLLLLGSNEVVGLIRGGSPGYLLSVSQTLRKLGWQIGRGVVPLTTVTIFIWAISRICFFVTLPTLSLFGVFEPEATPAAFFSRMLAGGDLRMKVKDLS